ncbi:L-serine ammonia-lyase, iron-sulfur-dependent, subunit alpha, partial [Candidatus Bathyarchaeota archaeon]|nr:L-serine ammonia-lyase, iron-sulfur-dependent, subunit alpha [Candidatus Bathyarchaeota archaeon]
MNLQEFFENEVKPALGCTEPGAVAYAASAAAKYLDAKIERIHIELSGNVFKNGVNVGVPGTNGGTGNPLAAALGAFAGDPEKGLQSLDGITMDDVMRAQELVDAGFVTQEVVQGVPNVYAKVILISEDKRVSAVISGRHDNLVEVTRGEEVVYSKGVSGEGNGNVVSYEDELAQLDMAALWRYATSITDEVADSLLRGAEMNLIIARGGLAEPWGLGVGYHINRMNSQDLLYRIKAYSGAAADARMGGGSWPVMSSAGSGNHGITAILPPVLYAEAYDSTERELAEALALSHLVTRFIKVYTGLLTPVCGCAVAAGAGAAAAIVKLAHGSPQLADVAVASLIASVMGMVCDGGKG